MIPRLLRAFAAGMAALLYALLADPDNRTALFAIGGVLWTLAGTGVVALVLLLVRSRRTDEAHDRTAR